MLSADAEANELEYDRTVIAATRLGPWHVESVDDDLCMNALLVVSEPDEAALEESGNNIAIVLLQSPRYADIKDGRWHQNAAFIARARTRWPEAIEQIDLLNQQLAALEQENAMLRQQASGND
ncbi:MAG TPA: hypothetical protein VLI90_08250 [Tepidisphaeraceae bacterium]|nr:hypothetical protein [Tepidisphaeraceae bacterium]